MLQAPHWNLVRLWFDSVKRTGLTCNLQTGTVFCYIFIFFTLQYPNGGVALKWWGNQVWMNSECLSF